MASSDSGREEALYAYHRKGPRTVTRSSSNSSLKKSKRVTRTTTTTTTTTTTSVNPTVGVTVPPNEGGVLSNLPAAQSCLPPQKQKSNGALPYGSSPMGGETLQLEHTDSTASPGIGFSPVVYPRLSVPLSIDTRNSQDLRSSTVLSQSPVKPSRYEERRLSEVATRDLRRGHFTDEEDNNSGRNETHSGKKLALETSNRYRGHCVGKHRAPSGRRHVPPTSSTSEEDEERNDEDESPLGETRNGRRSSTLEPVGAANASSGRSHDRETAPHENAELNPSSSLASNREVEKNIHHGGENRLGQGDYITIDEEEEEEEENEEEHGNQSDTMRPHSSELLLRRYEKRDYNKTHRSSQKNTKTTTTTTTTTTQSGTAPAFVSSPSTGNTIQAQNALTVIPAPSVPACTYALPPHFVLPMQQSISPSQSDSYVAGVAGQLSGPLAQMGTSYHSDMGSFSTGFNGSRAVRPPSSYTPEKKHPHSMRTSSSRQQRSYTRGETPKHRRSSTKGLSNPPTSYPIVPPKRRLEGPSNHGSHNGSRVYKVPPTSRRVLASAETRHSGSSIPLRPRDHRRRTFSSSQPYGSSTRHRSSHHHHRERIRHTESVDEESFLQSNSSSGSSYLWTSGSQKSIHSRNVSDEDNRVSQYAGEREAVIKRKLFHRWSSRTLARMVGSSPVVKQNLHVKSVARVSDGGSAGTAAQLEQAAIRAIDKETPAIAKEVADGVPMVGLSTTSSPAAPDYHFYAPTQSNGSQPHKEFEQEKRKRGKRDRNKKKRKNSRNQRRSYSSSSSSSSDSRSGSTNTSSRTSEESATIESYSSASSTPSHDEKRNNERRKHESAISPRKSHRKKSSHKKKNGKYSNKCKRSIEQKREARSSSSSSTSFSPTRRRKDNVVRKPKKKDSTQVNQSQKKHSSNDQGPCGGREVRWSSPPPSPAIPSAAPKPRYLDRAQDEDSIPHCLEWRDRHHYYHRHRVQVPCAYCASVRQHKGKHKEIMEEEEEATSFRVSDGRKSLMTNLNGPHASSRQLSTGMKNGLRRCECGQYSCFGAFSPKQISSPKASDSADTTTSSSESGLHYVNVSKQLLNDPHIAVLLRQLSPKSEKRIRAIFEGTAEERMKRSKQRIRSELKREESRQSKVERRHKRVLAETVALGTDASTSESTANESTTVTNSTGSTATTYSSEDGVPPSRPPLSETLNTARLAQQLVKESRKHTASKRHVSHSVPNDNVDETAESQLSSHSHILAGERCQDGKTIPHASFNTYHCHLERKGSKKMVPFHGRSQKLTRHKRIASSSSPKRSSRTPFCHRHLFPETFRALEKLVQVARHQQRIRHQEEERSAALLKLQQKEKEEEKEKQNRLMEERTEGEEVLKTSSLKTHNTLHAIEREIHNILEKHAPNLEGYVLPMTKVETGDSAGTPTTAILPPHHVHFYSSPFALIPSNFLFGMPAGPSSALPTSAPHPNVAAPLSPLPSVQSQEDQLHRAALREGSGQGSTPPVVRLTSVGGVETGRHQESLESQYEDRNAKKSERERVGGVPPLQMDQLSVLQEEEEGKPPAGKPLTEETLPPTSDLLPGGALKPSSSLASHELCKNRGGEGRAPVESLNVGVQWASPRDQETQHNYSVLASTAQSSVREDGSCSPAFSVNIVYPSAPEDVYTAAEGVPQTSSQLNENEALRTKTVSAQEEERCMPLTPSGQQLPSSHSDIPKSHEGNSHDKELNPKTDSHPKAGSSISSSSSPTATTTTDVGHSFFAGVPGMFYVCDDQGRFIPVADPSRAHLPLTPDGSQLRDPLYYVAGDSGVIPSSQVFSHPTSSTVHPPQCCPWNTFHDHSHEGRGVCGTHRRGVSRRRTTSSPGKGGLSWSMPPTPGTLGRSMRHGPVTSKDAQTTSSASTIHAQQHRHVSPYTSRLRQCSPSNRFQGDQNAGGRSSDDLPATGGPLGCSRLNPYCQVCRDRFRLVFVDENMNPVPMFTDGVSTTHVGGVRRREDRDSAGAIPSLSSASAGVRNDSVSLPVGAIPSYASPPQENPSCSGWSRPSTLRTRRTSQKSTTSRSAHNLGVACRYHGPYLFTEEEPQQTKGHSSQSSCRPLSLSSRRMDRCEGKRIVDVIDHREASSGIQERSSGHCPYPSSLPAAMQTKKPVSIHFDPARMPECLSKVEDQHSNSSPHQSAMNRERERRKKLISRIAQLRSTLERDSYSSAPYSDSHAYRDHREISQKNHMNHKHEVTEDGEVEEEEGGQESTGSRPSHWKSSMGMGSHVNDQGSVEKLSCVITGTGRGGSGKTIRAVEGQFVPVCFENTVGKPLGGC